MSPKRAELVVVRARCKYVRGAMKYLTALEHARYSIGPFTKLCVQGWSAILQKVKNALRCGSARRSNELAEVVRRDT